MREGVIHGEWPRRIPDNCRAPGSVRTGNRDSTGPNSDPPASCTRWNVGHNRAACATGIGLATAREPGGGVCWPGSGTATPRRWTVWLKMSRSNPRMARKRVRFHPRGTAASLSMSMSRRRGALRWSDRSRNRFGSEGAGRLPWQPSDCRRQLRRASSRGASGMAWRASRMVASGEVSSSSQGEIHRNGV